jgi:ABC-type molybdate transport system substrate-binding protein
MRPGSFARHLATLYLGVLAFVPVAAHAAEVRLIAANAVKESVLEVVSAFERASGHTVVTVWGGRKPLPSGFAAGRYSISR